jgi:glycosyltransferase involved in cell wall biosynthesis
MEFGQKPDQDLRKAVNPPQSISVVFPAYNEEENVERTVDVATEAIRRLTNDYEIIIVDDASTDRTYQQATKLSEANPHIRVIRHKVNQGLGGAIQTGLKVSTKDLILYSDIDLPFDFCELEKAVRIMKLTEAGVISAYRHDRTGEGLIRTTYSLVYNSLIRLLFGLKVKDVNFSFKLFKREVVNTIKPESKGSFIDAELLIKSKREGFIIQQIGVDYFPRTRGVSTLSRTSVILKIFREMIAYYFRSWMQRGEAGEDV